MYLIQSWDGNNPTYPAGPDIWRLSVAGGPILLNTTFDNSPGDFGQAYPSSYPGSNNPAFTGASEIDSLGYSFPGCPQCKDTVYNLSFTFAHSATSITIVFSGIGLQGVGDEGWGLDDVQVSIGAGITSYKPGTTLDRTANYIDIGFSLPINPETFTAEDVQLIAPDGSHVATSTPRVVSGASFWRIGFPSGLTPGHYHLQIGPNISDCKGESLGIVNDTTLTFVDATELSVGVPMDGGFTGTQPASYYRVLVDAGKELTISLRTEQGTATGALYASFGRIPSGKDYDYHGRLEATGDHSEQIIRMRGSRSGTYYILASAPADLGETPLEFTVEASVPSLGITSISPRQLYGGENKIQMLTVRGTSFDQHSVVTLQRAGKQDILFGGAIWVDTATILAPINVFGQEPGKGNLTVTNPDSVTASSSLDILPGSPSDLKTRLVLPSALGYHIASTLYIEYENVGLSPMAVPLLKLHGTSNALMSGDKSLAGEGLWTANPPPGLTDTVQVLALGSAPNVAMLKPGDKGRIPIYYRGCKQPWDFTYPPIKFDLYILTVDDETSIDWTTFEEQIRPSDADPGTWGPILERVRTLVGDKWGGYVASLDGYAKRLATANHRTDSVTRLLECLLLDAQGDPMGMVSGNVHDVVTQLPIAGAKIKLVDTYGAVVGESPSTSDGSFGFLFVMPGHYSLIVDQWITQGFNGFDSTGDISGLQVACIRAGSVSGSIMSTGGVGLSNVRLGMVEGPSDALWTITGPSGSYRIDNIPPGVWTLIAESDDHVSATFALGHVDSGQQLTHDLVLAQGSAIKGRVLNDLGQPLVGAKIIAFSESRSLQAATTDSDGFYSVSGLANGEWQIKASIEGYVAIANQISIASPEMIELHFTLSAGIPFEGRVTTLDGSSVPCQLLFWQGNEAVQASFTSNGFFQQNQLAPGNYRATVSSTGFLESEAEFSLTNTGLAEPLNIIVTPDTTQQGPPSSAESLPDREADALIDLLAYELALHAVSDAFSNLPCVGGLGIPGCHSASALLNHFLDSALYEGTGSASPKYFDASSDLSQQAEAEINCNVCFAQAAHESLPGIRSQIESQLRGTGEIGAISGRTLALNFYDAGTEWGGLKDVAWAFGKTSPGLYRVVASKVSSTDSEHTVTVTVEYTFPDVYEFKEGHKPLGILDSMAYELQKAGWAKPFRTALQIRQTFPITIPRRPGDPIPPGQRIGDGGSKSVGTADPNDKIGPSGFGNQTFLPADQPLPYSVYYENDHSASAAVRKLVITDKLDAGLNWSTFEPGDFVFGVNNVQVPAGASSFQADVAIDGWTYDDTNGWYTGGTPLVCHVSSDLNPLNGTITWTIDCRDPETGLPPEDAYAGFLPPNDDPPVTKRGEGHISYLVQPMAGLPSGTEFRNVAAIQFDANPIIATNQIDPHDPSKGTDPAKEALVTVDAGAPTSHVTPLPEKSSAYPLRVEWTGQDDAGGSGIATYDVYLSIDGGPWALWQTTSETSAEFSGQPGHSYAFYTVATDNVGYRESPPAAADAVTGTPIQIPGALNLGAITATTITITDLGAANMGSVEHAILEQTTGQYVGADGRLSAAAAWQSLDAWADKVVWGGLTPDMEYHFQVKARAAGTETEFGPVVVAITSHKGDADGDGLASGSDLAVVAAAMGSAPGQANWDPRADLNDDLVVDAQDRKLIQLARIDPDGDGDVDQTDFAHFQLCFTGPTAGKMQGGCANVDFNDDGKVDNADYQVFVGCASGPAILLNSECLN